MPNLKCPACGRSIRNLKDHVSRFHPEEFNDKEIPKSKYKAIQNPQHDPKSPLKTDQQIIIVDGQNVAYFGDIKRPSFTHLHSMYQTLVEIGYQPKIVISSALKYKIDDSVRLNKLINRGIALEAPSGEDDDLTVLLLARQFKAKIISNDRYLNHEEMVLWQLQTIRFQIVNRTIIFSPPLR